MAIIAGGLGADNKITSTYNGQKLSFVLEKQSTLHWDNHPVRITDAQFQTLNKERVFSILQGKNLMPSSLAGLQPAKIVCQTIGLIDKLYCDAISDYTQRLVVASEADFMQINTLITKYGWVPLKYTAGGLGACSVLGLALGSPLGPFGAVVGGAVGAAMGLISGFFGGKKLTQRTIEREGSAHRVKWMISVDVLEELRFKKIYENISNAVMPLMEDLKRLEQQNQTDKLKVRQLEQLCLVHQVIFGQTPFEIIFDPSTPQTKINIAEYMRALAGKFPALK